MKNTLKVINYVLLGLALVAVGFGVFAFFQYRAVPIAEYESSAADLRAQKGIPAAAMKNIRALWAGKAKEFVK